MMNNIKFRAWDKEDFKVRKVLAISFQHKSISVKLNVEEYLQDDASRFELMQYTGLKDKNGVEIYEGDIVRTGWQGNEKGVVVFESSTYCVDIGSRYMYFNHPESYEIIGNIYEHHDMLGDSQ